MCQNYKNVYVYGSGWDFAREYENIIKDYQADLTIQGVIDKHLGGVAPRSILLFHGDAISASNFTSLPSRVYGFISDEPTEKKVTVRVLQIHTFKMTAVFHVLNIGKERIKGLFPAKREIYFPNWAARCYDYQNNIREKNIDFFCAGSSTDKHYWYRRKIAKALTELNKRTVFKFGAGETEADNIFYRECLLSSMYSPHCSRDGALVTRYVESMFAKSVIISPDIGEEMKCNGLVDGETFLKIDLCGDELALAKKIESAVESVRWREVSEAAYHLVKEHHTSAARAKQLMEEMT